MFGTWFSEPGAPSNAKDSWAAVSGHPLPPAKAQLRLFTTFETERAPRSTGQASLPSKTGGSGTGRSGRPVGAGAPPASPPHSEGSCRWGLYRQVTGSLPLPLSLLLLRTLSPCDPLDERFRDHLLPRWPLAAWAVPCLAWQYRAWVEQPLVGVPGLVSYVSARSRWLDLQISAAARTDAATQVVILRSGCDSRAYRLKVPGVTFYEVDEREALAAKRALLDAVLPDRRKHPRPQFVAVSWSNIKGLIPALTAEGFDPLQRSVFVLEGVLPHMSPARVDELLEDVTALCAPGSRVCFDLLHQDVLEGAHEPAGYANLAEAAANKGAPFLSGLRPQYSALVRALQPYHLRVMEVLPAAQIAKQLLPGAQPGRGCLAQPLLPECFSLVVATKANPRLLLRHAAATTTSASEAGEWAAGLAAAAARSGPPCLLRSLLFLLGRGPSLAAPAHALATVAAAIQPAAPRPESPPPPVLGEEPSLPSAAAPPAVAEERSADWTLNTAVAAEPSSSPSSSSGRGRGGGDGMSFSRELESAAAAAGLDLDRAQSIIALPLPGGSRSLRQGSQEEGPADDETGPLSWWHQYAHLQ